MATKAEVEAYSKQYGDPLSGGALIKDEKGNVIGNVPYSADVSEAMKNNRTFYQDESGQWSKTPATSVTLNEETGDIDIKAPSYVLDNEAFKQGISDSGILKQLSAAYKADKNYSFPDPLDESKQITVKDMVARYDDYAQKLVAQTEGIRDFKDNVTATTGNRKLADALTNNDLILMRQTGIGEEDNDKTLISVPKTLQGNFYNNLRALGGYNTQNGVISKGDLRSGVYNVGKSSKEDIVDALTEAVVKVAEIEQKQDISAEDAEEYARLTAFITYLQKEEPEADFWQQLGLNFEGAGAGIMAAAHNVGGSLLVLGEGAANILNLVTSPWLWGKPSSEWASTAIKESYEADKMSDIQIQQQLQQINSEAAVLASLTEMGGTIAGTLLTGKVASDALTRLVSATVTTLSVNNVINKIVGGYDNLQTARIGTAGAGPTITAARATQAGLTAGLGGIPTASNLLNTAQNILNLSKLNPTQLSGSVNSLLNILANSAKTEQAVSIVNSAVKSINAINRVAGVGNVVGQIAIDTMITDGPLLRKMVENNDPEAAGEILGTVAFDAFLYTAGFAGAALLEKLPSSKIGRAATTRFAQAEAKAATTAVAVRDKIKGLVLRDADYISKIKNPSKRQVAQTNALINQATKNVAQAGNGLTGTDKTLDIENNLKDLVAVQNAVDLRIKGIQEVRESMFNADLSPALSSAYNDLVAHEQKINKLEKQYGLAKKGNYNVSKSGAELDTITIPSTNYINKYYRIGQIEDYYNANKSYKNGMEAELEANKKYVADFESKYPQLATELQAEIPIAVKANDALNDWMSKHQVLDKDRLAGMQKSPLFARNGYMHTQRVNDLEKLVADGRIEIKVLERKNTTIDDVDSYSFGSEENFLSPRSAFLQRTNEVASVVNAREMLEDFTRPKGMERKITLSGDEVKRAQEIKRLKDEFHREVVNSFKGSKETALKYDLGNKLAESFKAHTVHLTQGAKTIKSRQKVAHAQVKNYKVTSADKLEVFQSFSPAEISNYASKNTGVTFSNILEEDFNYFINPEGGVKGNTLATNLRREIRQSIAKNADFIAGAHGAGVAGAGEIASQLPKIKTSSYKKLMDIKTLKDADPAIKPYLSESGVDLESGDWGQWFGDRYQGDFEGSGSFSGTADEVVSEYLRIMEEAKSERELYKPTFDNFTQAVQFDPELPTRLNQIMLKTDGFLDSDIIKNKALENIRNATVQELDMVWKQDIEDLSEVARLDNAAAKDLVLGIQNVLTEYVYTGVMGNEAARTTIENLVKHAKDQEAAIEYVVFSELNDAKDELGGEIGKGLEAFIKQQIVDYNAGLDKADQLDYEKVYEKFEDVVKDAVYDRRNRAMNVLREESSPLVDEKGIFEETNKIMSDISKAEKDKKAVAYTNLDGLTEYAEVSPLIADLVNYVPTTQGSSFWEQLLSSKAFEITNRWMRLGSTGINPKSWVRQTFTDTANAYIGGGAVRPAAATEQLIAKNFGESIAEQFRMNSPEIYDQITKQAQEAGRTVGEQATRYAGATLETKVKTSLETSAYKLRESRNTLESMQRGANKVLEAFEAPNDFRETGLRKAVAIQALYDALKKGYSYNDAMNAATRAMRDSTTDFLRQTLHLQALTNTTPYLRSGINGSKSFWRLMSIDPVGVMARLTAGIILPVIASTIAIMTDDESREYYKTLYEREKNEYLIYKVNGKFMSIPLPQEVAGIVAPFRHLVESLYEGNRHSFWELAINDLVGLFPYDLTGFQDIDAVALAEDPTFFDRVKSLGMGLLADILPPVGKTAFELTYGVDPYTGKKIDKAYWYLDENDDLQLMDSTTSEFAQWVGSFTGWSPSVISTVVSNFMGTTGRDVLDSVVSMAQWVATGGKEGSAVTLLEKTITSASAPLSVTEYDRTKSAWNNEVSALFDEKEGMMKQYQMYTDEINAADSAERRQALIAKRNDYIAPFINKVRNTVTNLQTQLGGSLDSYRFATVISLMNFNAATGGGLNAYSRLVNSEIGYSGKEEARATIEHMNVAASPDTESLLGYMYVDKNGDVQTAFYTPLEILNAQSIYYAARDLHATNIQEIIENAGLNKEVTAAKNEIYSYSTTKEKDAAKEAWNNKVFKVMLPYFQKYGVEAVMQNDEIAEYLDGVIVVPTSYMKYNGKSTYNPNLDANRGFVKQYVTDVMTEILK